MDILFEILFEIIFEGSLEISQNRRISKWIRYPLIALLSLFFTGLIGLLLAVGIKMLWENVWVALFFVAVALFLLIGCIRKFRKLYLNKKEA